MTVCSKCLKKMCECENPPEFWRHIEVPYDQGQKPKDPGRCPHGVLSYQECYHCTPEKTLYPENRTRAGMKASVSDEIISDQVQKPGAPLRTPRIIWLAKTAVDAYANPTEPTLYPHGFTELVEKKYYDALSARVVEAERLLIQGPEIVKALTDVLATAQAENKALSERFVSKTEYDALEAAEQCQRTLATNLQIKLATAQDEIERLKEFEWMYKELCK